jgi:prolipoprotein diacylglyceryltransferase
MGRVIRFPIERCRRPRALAVFHEYLEEDSNRSQWLLIVSIVFAIVALIALQTQARKSASANAVSKTPSTLME